MGTDTAFARQASGRPGPSRPGSRPQVLGNRTVSMETPSRESGRIGNEAGKAARDGPLARGALRTVPAEARSALG